MNSLRILLIAAILSFSSLSFAQVTPPGDAGAVRESSTQRRMGEPASLVFWNRPITVFRAYNDEVSPAERAAKAAARLADLPAEASEYNVVANETSVGQILRCNSDSQRPISLWHYDGGSRSGIGRDFKRRDG